ncbi:GNAT family N-acetyltransferase [Rhizobium lentis]|uniref:CelD/BcsL family acetyltransferase involved in cellulose biosynthesis n=1 Tax=Rhizobium lentis TaxID=1138194 RepID=A0A7W8ULZ9_9HYPH|nr:GNAT family N-acetyltransferase [Rhizobium lentis]MBB4573711.1 CelD/BcsL family acetyltransferase involved in cellulose biosynthesis [Rhizobium lentis]MBB5549639.1 CelD/BcsL family acetyltransferase involved in cellulose biosynthesis [Rhizobium lentis]MBB5560353.1 CelD/BcsL family acetyltransferase involved in cellulose biosynthesis [Rhizobium lentis]MBB5566759.1 CelD/BcsL family acetyltransferase involved in cellulose biosynthesis [Rhizobium lentis]
MQTQKLDVREQPSDDGALAATAISRLRQVSMQLAMAKIDIAVFDAMQPLEDDWRALEADNLQSLHQSYDWCAAWVNAFQRPLAILKGTYAGETAFILPVEIVRSRGLAVAKFIAADHSNINTGLFSRNFAESGGSIDAEKFARQLQHALKGRADLLLLQNIPLEWRGRQTPLTGLPMVQNQNHAYQLPLLAVFEETLKQINAKSRRKKFRVQSRRLEAAGGVEYVIPETSEEQHRLLDIFFRLKSARFASLGLPDVFADRETQAFLHGLIDKQDETGQSFGLKMHVLRLKGGDEERIAAISGISRKGDHVICQFGAIDEDLVPDTSPGEFLYWQTISGLHGKGVALFDFGLGDQTYKRSWAPVETAHYDVVLPVSPIGVAAGAAHRIVTRSKAHIKARPKLYKFAQGIRARIG